MRYQQADNIISREIGGEHLLVPIGHNGASLQKVYLLNETAAAVWELLAEPRTVAQIITALLEDYDAPEAELREDVERLLADLVERKFLVVQ